jgi:hypothetical protein
MIFVVCSNKRKNRLMTATASIKNQSLLPDEDHTWVIHGRAYDLRTFAERHPGMSMTP